MPELPEVETVCQGLRPFMEGVVFERVILYRRDLRFAFSPDFVSRLQGQRLVRLDRRAKFLKAELGSGDRLYMHLGMTGQFRHLPPQSIETERRKHDHVMFLMENGYHIIFNDSRRFGFMELVASGQPDRLDKIGPEPLGNQFNSVYLHTALRGRRASIKAALLDQRLIAGLGNIYVCEALFRAGISPRRQAGRISRARIDELVRHIRQVLREAIEAGGTSLRDFVHTDGTLGYFQHGFVVYGREGAICPRCQGVIIRIVQTGRSSFFCRGCQR